MTEPPSLIKDKLQSYLSTKEIEKLDSMESSFERDEEVATEPTE